MSSELTKVNAEVNSTLSLPAEPESENRLICPSWRAAKKENFSLIYEYFETFLSRLQTAAFYSHVLLVNNQMGVEFCL